MPNITFVDHLGSERTIAANAGGSLMEAARLHDVPGIDADCGGVCACATCHVYVEKAFFDRLAPPGAGEEPMLEFVDEPRPTSRLACQIRLSDDLDGMKVETPARQK